MRTKFQVSPNGAWREAALLELDTEGHMMLGQNGCCLGCPFLIATLNGPGQAPCQLCCKERESTPSQLGMAACPNPLQPPVFTILQVSRTRGNIHLSLGGLGCVHFRETGWGNRAHFWGQGRRQAVTT